MKRMSSKIMYLGVCLMSVILVASYTANLSANLTVANLSSNIKSVNDLTGKKVNKLFLDLLRYFQVGVIKGSLAEEDLKTPGGARDVKPILASVNQTAEMFDAAEKGDVDAIWFDVPILQYYLKTHPDSNLGVVGNVLAPSAYAICVNKNHVTVAPGLLQNLNYYTTQLKEREELVTN